MNVLYERDFYTSIERETTAFKYYRRCLEPVQLQSPPSTPWIETSRIKHKTKRRSGVTLPPETLIPPLEIREHFCHSDHGQ